MALDAPGYCDLKGFGRVGDTLFSTNLECNLKEFFEFGLLRKGGYFNIVNGASSSGAYGGNYSRLRYDSDSRYPGQSTFSTFRAPIVWQSGNSVSSGAWADPIRISGVTAGGTFLPRSTTGASGYYINYELGRVVFPTSIPTTNVTMNYSYYWANIWTSNKAAWLQRAFSFASRVDNATYSQTGSGHFNFFRENRIELPAVVIEVVPRYIAHPQCLGDGRPEVHQTVLFHVWAESAWERNQLKDIILFQDKKTFYLFDINNMELSGALPFNSNGDLRAAATMYNDWVAPNTQSGSFRYACGYLDNMDSVQILDPQPNLYTATVRAVAKVQLPNI